jgi:hypothetical protein
MTASFPTPETIGKLPIRVFDAVAAMHIYFHCDLAYPGVRTWRQRKKHLKVIQTAGYCTEHALSRDEEGEFSGYIAELYNEALEAFVQPLLPSNWGPHHDYWGAKCFAEQTWQAPKHETICAGETTGFYAFFSCARGLLDSLPSQLDERGIAFSGRHVA